MCDRVAMVSGTSFLDFGGQLDGLGPTIEMWRRQIFFATDAIDLIKRYQAAAEGGHVTVVKQLLTEGIAVNVGVMWYKGPANLQAATLIGHL